MAKSENTPDPIFAILIVAALLIAAGPALAQRLQPSTDDLRLEDALSKYRNGARADALDMLAAFSREQVVDAPKTFHRTLTGMAIFDLGRDAAPARLALGLLFVEAGLAAFAREDEDLSGALLSVAHYWLMEDFFRPYATGRLMVPLRLAEDLCVVSVGPLIEVLQLDAARKAWALCPPHVQKLPHAMVLRGSIEEIAVSERMDPDSHYYVPGAHYDDGGRPRASTLRLDRLAPSAVMQQRHTLRERAWRLRTWREAEGWYARALEADPSDSMARLRLSVARWQLDEEREAAFGFPWLLDAAHRVTPDVRYLAHLFSARKAEEEGPASLERAERHYQHAIRIMPKNQVAYFGLSRLRFDSDRAEAARLVREAVARPPDEQVDPWFNYDMQFAFEAAALRELRYREVQEAAGPGGGDR